MKRSDGWVGVSVLYRVATACDHNDRIVAVSVSVCCLTQDGYNNTNYVICT